MNKYDIIIIGSGLGGLVCGYILSKHGYKVAILEQGTQIGGCLQTFRRSGVVFDTGMHYIGSMDEGQILYRLFDYLDLLKDVRLSRLDENGYDVFNIAGEEFRYASGYENFIDTLATSFPNQKQQIANYVRGIRDIADASPLYNMRNINITSFIEPDYVKRSVNEFISSFTTDNKLANVLAGNLPLYAGVKDKTPIYIHALINTFYIQSAWRIVGGGDCIASSLADSIKKAGGEIFTSAKVVSVKCNDTCAEAVVLDDGRRFEAKSFISNIHPQTLLGLIDETRLIRKAYKDRIMSLENTTSCFTVYLKFKDGMMPYRNHNYYYYKNQDVWSALDYDEETYPGTFVYMHQCHEENPKYAKGAELIGYMKWSEVIKWENTCIGHRGDGYKQFKKEKAEQMINRLEECFPGTKAAIESYVTSSPLTYRDYTGTYQGSIYGVIRDKNFPTQTLVSQRTKIPNLFMTGQNINSHGILGVTIGAAITCAEYLGLKTIIQEIDK